MRLLIIMFSGLLWSAEVITTGEKVDIEGHLASGKYTLFDFYADWCGPCRQLEPILKQFESEYSNDLSLKKVDIVNWSSPVAQQYGIRSIPHLKLYGPDGKLVRQGDARAVLMTLQNELGGEPLKGAAGGSGGLSLRPLLIGMAILALMTIALFVIIGYRSSMQTKRQLQTTSRSRLDHYAMDPTIQPVWSLPGRPGEGPFSVEDLRSEFLSNRLTRDTPVVHLSESQPRRLGDVLASY